MANGVRVTPDRNKNITEWRKQGGTGKNKWMSDKDYSAMSDKDKRGWSFEKRERPNPNWAADKVALGLDRYGATMSRGGILLKESGEAYGADTQAMVPTSLKVAAKGQSGSKDMSAAVAKFRQ